MTFSAATVSSLFAIVCSVQVMQAKRYVRLLKYTSTLLKKQ